MSQTFAKTESEVVSSSAFWIRFLLVSLLIFVTFFSAFFFSTQSIRLDESQSIWQTSHSPARILEIVAEDVHVPLYHLILHFWEFFFGTEIVLVRLLSFLFFLISIPLFYKLANLSLRQKAALFAVALFAFSPFLNWYGNEARMYSLFVFLTILNQYFFIRIYKDESENNPLIWTGYTLSFLLGIFTHYFFLFYIVVQAVFFLRYKKYFPKGSFQKFAIVSFAGAVALAPWLWYVQKLGIAGQVGPLLVAPSTINIFNTFSQFIFGFQTDHVNSILLALWPIAVLLVFLAIQKNKKIPLDVMYYFFSFMLPIILVFLVSIFIRPIYLTRYLVFTLPSLYLFISWMVASYPQKLSNFLKMFLLVGMFCTLIVEARSASVVVKEDYKSATEYLNLSVKEEDLVIVSAPFTIYPIEYYYRANAPVTTLPIWNRYQSGLIPVFSQNELEKDVTTLKAGHKTIWLVLSYDQGYESAIRLYFDTHFERVGAKNFSHDLNIYEYKLRYDDDYLKYIETHPQIFQ